MNLEYDVNKCIFELTGAEKDLIDEFCKKINPSIPLTILNKTKKNTAASHSRKTSSQQLAFDGTFKETVGTDQPPISCVRKLSRKRN